MPIYEYQCKKCNQVHEEFQKFSDAPLKKCPECGGRVKKLMSLNTFQLKGSGWYVTDYANKKTPADASPSKKKEEKSSDDKPAKKKTESTDK